MPKNICTNNTNKMTKQTYKRNLKSKYMIATICTIAIIFIILFSIRQSSQMWAEIREQEENFRLEYKNKELNQKKQQSNNNKQTYQQIPLVFEGYQGTIHIYQTHNQTDVKCLGTILYILGKGDHVFARQSQIIELNRLGYNIICMQDRHTLNVYKDIGIQQSIWEQGIYFLEQQGVWNPLKSRIVIGHCYGALIASFLSLNSKQFNKLILITPYLQLDVKMPIVLRNYWILSKKSFNLKQNRQLLFDTTKNNQLTIGKCLQIQHLSNEIFNFNERTETSICMILSNQEHLSSNQRALQFFNRVDQEKKKCIISNKITHMATGYELVIILKELLEF